MELASCNGSPRRGSSLEHETEALIIVVRDEGETDTARGDDVHVAFRGPVHVFGADGSRLGD